MTVYWDVNICNNTLIEPSPRERVQNLGKTQERKDRHAETSSA